MDNNMNDKTIKQLRKRFGYEKSIVTQIHEEIFQTTSEHKYYELGVATGIYSICQILDNMNKCNCGDVKVVNIINALKQWDGGNSNIKELLSRMRENDKLEE